MSKCIRLPTKGTVLDLEPTDYIPPESVPSVDPRERGKSVFANQTGQLDAGVWECERNKHVIAAAPYDEFVYLLEGRIDVIDDEGGTQTYKAGDSFIMPRGCRCTWMSRSLSANSTSCSRPRPTAADLHGNRRHCRRSAAFLILRTVRRPSLA